MTIMESVETVVIGAGHGGLSPSYFLQQHGREHIVLDKAGFPGNAWRSERWDSFTFVSPNWSFQLPGGEYDGPEPDGYMSREELVARFTAYVTKYRLPVAYNTCVTSVQPLEDKGFLVRTPGKDYRARNVITANGWFQAAKRPQFAGKVSPSIFQLHSSQYRNPQTLPPGAVLVVGSGQSGAQIAEELNQSGRKVFLATGTAPHSPRRYRGKDIFNWMVESGFVDQTFEHMQNLGRPFVGPLISGKAGGHALNLHIFHRDGVILLGHVRDFEDGKLIIEPDLKENLRKADMGMKFTLEQIDHYIQRAGVDAPDETYPILTDGYQAGERTSLDLQAEGISTIIWACGYSYDSSIFSFPVTDRFGLPDAPNGVSQKYPGLFFSGFPFMPGLKSGFVAGVAKTAGYVAQRITERAMGAVAV
jgi:putative flavoprotein involved in K+ transport